MQATGIIIVNNKSYVVLVRPKKTSISFKLAKGKTGNASYNYNIEDGKYFEKHPEEFKRLLAGEVISI